MLLLRTIIILFAYAKLHDFLLASGRLTQLDACAVDCRGAEFSNNAIGYASICDTGMQNCFFIFFQISLVIILLIFAGNLAS